MRGQLRLGLRRGLDGREYGPTSHLSEADLFAGYAGLGRKALRDAEFREALTGEPVPPVLLLRGRRCPCGSHDGPMSALEQRQRQMAALTIAEEAEREKVAS